MRIALIGARGQLGTDLVESLDGDVVCLGHEEIEITDASSVERVLSKIGPDRVINAAAYNLVDQAEDEPEVAYAVNACGPRHLARFCAAREIVLLHVSSDYVFGLDEGRSVPYRESDTPGPLSSYAVSKLSGEYFVRSQCPRHFVVRTCGLYGHAGARGKGNFVETMLRLSAERTELTVVDDQHCTPTATADLARALAALIKTDAFGLYHATNAGNTTWCGFAREIVRWTNRDVKIRPITSAEFGAPSSRPDYSVLDNSKLTATIGFELPPWENALSRYLEGRN